VEQWRRLTEAEAPLAMLEHEVEDVRDGEELGRRAHAGPWTEALERRGARVCVAREWNREEREERGFSGREVPPSYAREPVAPACGDGQLVLSSTLALSPSSIVATAEGDATLSQTKPLAICFHQLVN
jgi:hypothetical protein